MEDSLLSFSSPCLFQTIQHSFGVAVVAWKMAKFKNDRSFPISGNVKRISFYQLFEEFVIRLKLAWTRLLRTCPKKLNNVPEEGYSSDQRSNNRGYTCETAEEGVPIHFHSGANMITAENLLGFYRQCSGLLRPLRSPRYLFRLNTIDRIG